MNKETIKIIHIMTGFGGGISSFIFNKALYFKQDPDFIFDVVTFGDVSLDFKKAIEDTGGEIVKITSPEKNVMTFFRETNAYFREQSIHSIVHSHLGMNLGLVFFIFARMYKISRFFIHAHTSSTDKEVKSVKNRIKRLINSIISKEKVSCGKLATINIFGERYVQENSVVHIPNSIEPEEFSGIKKNSFNNLANSKVRIGHIGRFHEQKNHIFMVDIIERLSESFDNFIWYFVGEGNLKIEIEQLIKEKNLTKYVEFLGRRSDIPELLSSFDVFVLPSLYEGLPTVAVESQASGTNCILSDKITSEADLGMGIVQYLSIDNADVWVEAIKGFKSVEIDAQQRTQILKEKKFTNYESAKLYKNFLLEKITNYEI